MEIQDKLKDLQSLLESGAITQDEFGSLKNQILGDHFSTRNTPPEVENSIDYDTGKNMRSATFKTYNGKRYSISNDLSRRPEKIVNAGSKIKTAVILYVLSLILSLILCYLAFHATIATMMRVAQGRSYDLSEYDSVFFVSILLGIVIIGYITVMYKAGSLLADSEATNSWRESMQRSKKLDYKGFKVGQHFEGGIIAFFYKTNEDIDMSYIGIACELDFPNEMSYNDAIKACTELKDGGYDDWFLPSSAECYDMSKNFKSKGVGNLKEGEYWGDEFYDNKKVVVVSSDKVKISTLSMKSHGNLARVRPMRIVRVLPELMLFHSWRELTFSMQRSKKLDYKGFKIGQHFEGGIIAFFYKPIDYFTDTYYIGIASELDFPNEMSYNDAIKACTELKDGGYDDWFLPSSAECYDMSKNFKSKGVGNLKEGEYWGDELHDNKNVVVVSSDKVKISTLSMKSHGNLARVRPMRIVRVLPYNF